MHCILERLSATRTRFAFHVETIVQSLQTHRVVTFIRAQATHSKVVILCFEFRTTHSSFHFEVKSWPIKGQQLIGTDLISSK